MFNQQFARPIRSGPVTSLAPALPAQFAEKVQRALLSRVVTL